MQKNLCKSNVYLIYITNNHAKIMQKNQTYPPPETLLLKHNLHGSDKKIIYIVQLSILQFKYSLNLITSLDLVCLICWFLKQKKKEKSMLFCTFSCGRKELVERVLAQNIWMLLAHMAAYLYSIASPNFIWPIKFDKVKSEVKDISFALSAQRLEKLNSDTFMLRKMDR